MHRLGLDAAFTPRARAIGDLVTAHLVQRLEFEASAGDLPFAIDLLRSAARTGAGIGLIGGDDPGRITSDTAGALAQARADLPAAPAATPDHVRYVLWAGHHVARCGDDVVAALAERLDHRET